MTLPQRPFLSDEAHQKIRNLERLLNYTFNDRAHAWKAIQVVRKVWKGGNRGMALLGDNLIYTILCQGWLPLGGMDGRHGGKLLRTFIVQTALTKITAEWHDIRNTYATNEHFAISVRGRLEDCLMCDVVGGKNALSEEMMGTAVEAVVAAVYIDSGLNMRLAERVAIIFGILPESHITSDEIRFWDDDESGDEEENAGDLLGQLDNRSAIARNMTWTASDRPGDPFGLLSDAELLPNLTADHPVLAFSKSTST